jgi:hypothetical protein
MQDAFDGDSALEGRRASLGGGGERQEGHDAQKSSAAQADGLLHACAHA